MLRYQPLFDDGLAIEAKDENIYNLDISKCYYKHKMWLQFGDMNNL